MYCESCKSEIDPKWKHATESNVCPFCGEQIMAEELRQLLHSLRDVMEQATAKEYASPVMEWLQSNCGLIHKNDAKNYLTDEDKQSFIDEGIKQAKQEIKNSVFNKTTQLIENNAADGIVIDKTTNERTSGFLQRAGISTNEDESIAEKTQRLKSERHEAHKNIKALVNKIQNGETEEISVQEPSEQINLYPDDNEEDYSEITLDNEQIPSHVLAMAASKGSSSGANVKDLMTLQRLKSKRRSSFNRDGKNGFSRSS